MENILDDPLPIDDSFPDEQLAVINVSCNNPWYADYANYIVAKYIPPSYTYPQKEKFFFDLRDYFWDDPHLYKGVGHSRSNVSNDRKTFSFAGMWN